MHLFGRTRDHDYYFELLPQEEQNAQSVTRCWIPHHGDFRAVLRANRISQLVGSPISYASSSTSEPPVFSPWLPWPSFCHIASSGGNTYCAIAECCALRRFHPDHRRGRAISVRQANGELFRLAPLEDSSGKRRRLGHITEQGIRSCAS